MVEAPNRTSPLHNLAMPRVADGIASVDLSERLCGSLVQVQAWPDTVEKVAKSIEKSTGVAPRQTQAAVTKNDTVVMPSGPGRWLIDDEVENLEDKLRSAIDVKMGAVTGLTHARVVVSIAGEKASWVLASGIAIDFDLAAFPVGDVQLGHHHEIGLTIHRTSEDSFDLYVFTSLARAFWNWIARASAEVGYSVS